MDRVRPAAMVLHPDALAETAPGLTAVHLVALTEGLSRVPVPAAPTGAPGANGSVDHAVTSVDRANVVNRQPRCRKST